jgi:hypothetical protein
MTMCTLLVAMALAALLVWSPLFRQACLAAALLFAMLAFAFMSTASAQRCPAGQDQFMNCYSLDAGARAKHEAWANQPAARRIPGAQPYGTAEPPLVTGASQMRQGVDYSMDTPSGRVVLHHHYDGKSTTVTRADGSRMKLVTFPCGSNFCITHNGRVIRRVPR